MLIRYRGNAIEQLKIEIQRLTQGLNFDDKGGFHINDLPDIEKAARLIDDAGSQLSEDLFNLCGNLCTYYLFYARDKNAALHLLTKLKNNLKPGQDYLACLAMTAYAHTFDDDFNDDTLFQELLTPSKTPDLPEAAPLLQAFCKRNIALMSYRKSLNNELSPNQKNDFLSNAEKIVKEARKIESFYLYNEDPFLRKDIAESTYILGIIQTGMGRYAEALETLETASIYLNEFCELTERDYHPLMSLIQQSKMNIWMHEEIPEMYLSQEYLNNMLSRQIKYYGTENHLDIARTFLCLGEVCAHNGENKTALKNYLRALQIQKNKDASLNTQRKTQTAMVSILTRILGLSCDDFGIKRAYEYEDIAELAGTLHETVLFENNLEHKDQILQLGVHHLQLGIYYNNVARNPVQAVRFLQKGKTIFEKYSPESEELAWINNHLALSHHQQFATYKNVADKLKIQEEENPGLAGYEQNLAQHLKMQKQHRDEALRICDEVIKSHKFHQFVKGDIEILAFALHIKAVTQYVSGNLEASLNNYITMRNLCTADKLDIHFAKIKYHYARMLAEREDPLAKMLFEELEDYTDNYLSDLEEEKDIPASRDNRKDLAKFIDSHGDYLEKCESNPAEALERFLFAYHLLHEIGDTNNSEIVREKIVRLRKAAEPAIPRLSFIAAMPEFDWNHNTSIEAYEKNIDIIKTTLEEIQPFEKFLDEIQLQQLSHHYLQLGAYYSHRKPDQLETAESYLEKAKDISDHFSEDNRWAAIHLAFVWQQQAEIYKNKIGQLNKEKAKNPDLANYKSNLFKLKQEHERLDANSLSYSCGILDTFAESKNPEHIRLHAFARYVMALNAYKNDKDLEIVIENMRSALDLYESIDASDDQYDRVKNLLTVFVDKYDALLAQRFVIPMTSGLFFFQPATAADTAINTEPEPELRMW